ncbi:hypothetical protein GWK47_003844 [Chionoecetes opilio]|uniref:Uncharacterized protein n=1 Tax=Chionoecetes opilio TaxID=41210 RepID=A0A8J4YH45_CHIOP|nr:hypothetical protein GWK47_003844 [Chionoecetes opilio]
MREMSGGRILGPTSENCVLSQKPLHTLKGQARGVPVIEVNRTAQGGGTHGFVGGGGLTGVIFALVFEQGGGKSGVIGELPGSGNSFKEGFTRPQTPILEVRLGVGRTFGKVKTQRIPLGLSTSRRLDRFYHRKPYNPVPRKKCFKKRKKSARKYYRKRGGKPPRATTGDG